LVEKPEGERTPERPRTRWVENVKVDLGDTEYGGIGCIDLS
jgi:hypothetical protein